MIVTGADRPDERRKIDAHGTRVFSRVVHCANYDDVCDRVGAGDASSVILDFETLPSGGSRAIARHLDAWKDPDAIFVLHDLSPRATKEMLTLASLELPVDFVYRKMHKLEDCLEHRPPTGVRSATAALLAPIARVLGEDIAHVFVCLVVLGERHMTMSRAAATIGIGVKRLRAKLDAAGLPTFRTLMAKLRIAHAIYRMDAVGVSAEIAAQCGGFEQRGSLDNLVKKYFGGTARQLMRGGGFDAIRVELAGWFDQH